MDFDYNFDWLSFLKYSVEQKINKALKGVLIIFPIALIIYILLSDLNGNKNLIEISKELYLEIFYGLILISTGYFIRYLRWRIILSTFKFTPLKKLEWRLWLASYAFTTTPGKVGELIRCFFLNKVFNFPLKYSLVSIFLERFYDLLAVLFITITFTFVNFREYIFTINFIN